MSEITTTQAAGAQEAQTVEQPVREGQGKPNAKDKSLFAKVPKNVPESTAKIAAFMNFNCDIRRHVAKNIIVLAKEAGFVKTDSKCYVNFFWDKFRLKENGLNKEYLYTEHFFIKAFAKAFEDIAVDAGKALEAFMKDNEIYGDSIADNDNTAD